MNSVKPRDVNLEELRQQLYGRIIRLFLIVCVGGIVSELSRPTLPGIQLFVWVVLLIAALLIERIQQRWYSVARHLLVWISISGVIAEMLLAPAEWIPFVGLPLILVATLITHREEYVAALLIGGVAWWLTYNAIRTYPVIELSAALAGSIVLGRIIKDNIYTALQWAWNSQVRSTELLEVSRDRQGELNRALKSLELAYALQARTQRELHFARQQAEEARQIKERFAANISHELRTPLNLILGFSEIMYISPQVYGDLDWPPALRRDIHHVYRSSRHLLELIDDILDLSRLDLAEFSLNREPTDITPLLESVVEMTRDLFRSKSVEVRLQVEGVLPTLNVDRTRIRQILFNLLNNAQRFTEEGSVTITAKEINNEVLITVQDTGSGIPQDKLPYIFDEFYQVDFSLRRSHEGAGLGLAICHRFVQAHQGRIWVESELGVGTTFSFSLPAETSPTRIPFMSTPIEAVPPADERRPILVMDTDPRVVALISRHLPDEEIIQITEVDQLTKHIDLHHPRAVICNMPEGTLPAYLNDSKLPVPIIVCSLPSQAWIAHHFQVTGCLTKPIDAQDLVRQIRELDGVRSVLVIDDDRGFCHLVERILQSHCKDIRLRMVYNGEAGLNAIREDKPDLVLLDLAMPGVDGFHVLDSLHNDPTIQSQVILLTATNFAVDVLGQSESMLTVRQPSGLRLGEVLRCLRSVVASVEPHYELAPL